MATNATSLQFDINPAVVFRLGEELITDAVQALVELVKNSYDADATWVNVAIDTKGANASGSRYADAKGMIVVEDNGDGMDEAAVRGGWMMIANSPKRGQKAAGGVSRRGRTPIGDKGLGRLGSQRLAQNVEIFTRSRAAPETEHYIGFSWDDFRGRRSGAKFRRDGRARATGAARRARDSCFPAYVNRRSGRRRTSCGNCSAGCRG